MFKYSVEKKLKGFVLIYTIFITTICFILVQAVFTLEYKHKLNSENKRKYLDEFNQFYISREAIFTKLDKYINDNVEHTEENFFSDENIKNYFNNKETFKLTYKGSLDVNKNQKAYLEYDKKSDTFFITYFIEDTFYKKEVYKYKVKDKCVLYGNTDYSFSKEEKFD